LSAWSGLACACGLCRNSVPCFTCPPGVSAARRAPAGAGPGRDQVGAAGGLLGGARDGSLEFGRGRLQFLLRVGHGAGRAGHAGPASEASARARLDSRSCRVLAGAEVEGLGVEIERERTSEPASQSQSQREREPARGCVGGPGGRRAWQPWAGPASPGTAGKPPPARSPPPAAPAPTHPTAASRPALLWVSGYPRGGRVVGGAWAGVRGGGGGRPRRRGGRPRRPRAR
jgi:hypothetical protein